MERAILHSDLNCFYASVEMMLDPRLRGKAVAVCGCTEDRHGIVLAKSEKAKRAGVKTGMVNWEAQHCCKDLIIVPPQYDQYLKYSKLTQAIYQRYTDMVEPFGMDECWLDVTGSRAVCGDAMNIAEQIRRSVREELGLTVSIGVSFNKVFAKLGSDMKKPDAITEISSDAFREKVWPLPCSDMIYCGPATTAKLARYGVRSIGDVAACDPVFLKGLLGVNGLGLWSYANGRDNSRVISNYTASCNGLSSSNTTGSALSVGKIAKSGSVTVTLTVTDSRGYTASVSQTITVIPYAKPKVSSVSLRRTNDIEAEMQLKFSGSISAVIVDGTQKNSVVYVRYRYKKTSESSYGSYTSIYSGTTKSGTSFSYSNLELCSLDANSSYDLHLQIQDKLYSLSSLDLYFTVPQGTPLIALRKKKVGINTPEPQAMLDVAGDMRVDGSPLADFVIQQGTSGIWNYRKWKSGTAECWGQYSFTTAISTAWGVLYESGAIALPNFPFTFAEIPHVHISTENSNYAMFVERGSSSSWSTTTNPGKIFAVRPNTVPSATYKVSIYAIGKV